MCFTLKNKNLQVRDDNIYCPVCGHSEAIEKIGWVDAQKQLPEYQDFVLFCLNNGDLNTTYLGWMEDGKDTTFQREMWYADGADEWFEKNQVLAWFPFPKCDIPHNNALERGLETAWQS